MSVGLVQRQASEGMEEYIPFDRDECKGGRIGFIGSKVDGGEESVVGVSGGHTITEGEVSACFGNTTSNLTNASTMRSEPNGESIRTTHIGRATNFNFSHGEQACYEANIGLSSNCGV